MKLIQLTIEDTPRNRRLVKRIKDEADATPESLYTLQKITEMLLRAGLPMVSFNHKKGKSR